jgi:predicted MFS family arabinose efflux permease
MRLRRGWGVVLAYGLVAAATQMLWLTYVAITTETARRYGVSESAIGWLSEIFPLLYVLLAIPAGALLDRWFREVLALGKLAGGLGGWAACAHPLNQPRSATPPRPAASSLSAVRP